MQSHSTASACFFSIPSASGFRSKSKYGNSKPSPPPREYNEHCVLYDSSASCNSTSGLMCLDSGLKGYRCLCPQNKLHAQSWDPKRNQCVGKVLNACVRPSNLRAGSPYSKVTPLNETLCVDNSECNSDIYGIPVCVCKPGFTESEGSCVTSLRYGDKCGTSEAGNEEEPSTEPPTTTTTEMTKQREARDASGDSDGLKKKCDEKSGLACIDSRCQCRFPSEQFYSESESRCISKAEGRCSHDTHVYSCVPNAHCPAPPVKINIDLSSGGTGGGPGSFLPPLNLPSFIGGILSSAGVSAEREGPGEGGENGEGAGSVVISFKPGRLPPLPPPPIRPGLGLGHRHRFPHFPDLFKHGHHAGVSASGSAGASAASASASASSFHPLHAPDPFRPETREEPEIHFAPFDDDDDMIPWKRSIIFGTSTISKKGQKDHYPRCQCLPGYSRTAAGFCMKTFGSKCYPLTGNETTSEELCNPDEFLECMDTPTPASTSGSGFTCQCRNVMNERFDPEVGACVAMVGRHCREMGPECEKGSECREGTCACANGTSMTPMETCLKDYGEKCEPGECNAWKGLSCHGKSKSCLCLDSYLRYEEGKGACVAGKGSLCGEVRAAVKKGGNMNMVPEAAYVECEMGAECKQMEIGGRKMGSRCV